MSIMPCCHRTLAKLQFSSSKKKKKKNFQLRFLCLYKNRDMSYSNELPADFSQFKPSTRIPMFESTQYHYCLFLITQHNSHSLEQGLKPSVFTYTFPFFSLFPPFSKLHATSTQSLKAKHRGLSNHRRFHRKSYKNSCGKDCASPSRANGKGAINARTHQVDSTLR